MPAKQTKKAKPAASVQPYTVNLTDTAAAAYARFYERAQKADARGDNDSAHLTTLRQLDDALEKIIPSDPFNKKFALVGSLRPIFRLHQGRLRICWVGSSERRFVEVIFISETLRKEGDKNDPYEVLSRKVRNGEFDDVFRALNLQSPLRKLTDTR